MSLNTEFSEISVTGGPGGPGSPREPKKIIHLKKITYCFLNTKNQYQFLQTKDTGRIKKKEAEYLK